VPRLAFASNYATGAPSSSFVFTATGFPASAEAEIAIKAPDSDSYQPRAVWPLGEEGKLEFALLTQPDTTPGIYRVRITVQRENPALASMVQMEQVISIDPEEPTRTDAVSTESSLMLSDTVESQRQVYLPLVRR
jgi:hypothetical protein